MIHMEKQCHDRVDGTWTCAARSGTGGPGNTHIAEMADLQYLLATGRNTGREERRS